MSASRTTRNSHLNSLETSTRSTTPSSSGDGRTLRPRGPSPSVTKQNTATSRSLDNANHDAPTEVEPQTAMKRHPRLRRGTSTTPIPTPASHVGGKLRSDPLLDLLIQQKEKPLQSIVQLEGVSAEEVEKAALAFLEASRRCFQTSMAAMELEEEEMESDRRSQERDNVMSAWTDMLRAGRLFFDCNQYEVVFKDDVVKLVHQRNGPLTETTDLCLVRAINLFNAMVLVKNITVPDSVATELEELDVGAAAERVTARNAVLGNLWAGFWHIVPSAGSEEMELWMQFASQLAARFQSYKILEEKRIKDPTLPKPKSGTFWGRDVFPKLCNLDEGDERFGRLLAQWKILVKSARVVTFKSNPPHWQMFEDSMLDYIRRKSDDLLGPNPDSRNSVGHSSVQVESDGAQDVAEDDPEPAGISRGDEVEASSIAGDTSMTEPVDMRLFLELAQELEAEKTASSPLVLSPAQPSLTPLIRKGLARPNAGFDWLARQKDAVQITWETQDPAPASPQQERTLNRQEMEELPGESQLEGSNEALVEGREGVVVDVDDRMEGEDELPTMTQLQGEPSLGLQEGRTKDAAATQHPDPSIHSPQGLLDGEKGGFADRQSISDDGDAYSEGHLDEVPSETQLRGDASAFMEAGGRHERVLSQVNEEMESPDTQLPTETQLYGASYALADSPPLAGRYAVSETEESGVSSPRVHLDEASADHASELEQLQEQPSIVELWQGLSPGAEVIESPETQLLASEVDGIEIAITAQKLTVVGNVSSTVEEAEPDDAQVAASDDAGGQRGRVDFGPGVAAEATRTELPNPSQLEGGDIGAGVNDDLLSEGRYDDDELPSADQLQGEDGFGLEDEDLSSEDRFEAASERAGPLQPANGHLAAEAAAESAESTTKRKEQPNHATSTTAIVHLHESEVTERSARRSLSELRVVADLVPNDGQEAEVAQSTDGGMMEVEYHPEPTDEINLMPQAVESTSKPQTEVTSTPSVQVIKSRTIRGTPNRLSQRRRAEDHRTEFASPDPADGPEGREGSESAAEPRGPRRSHRMYTGSPVRRSERFSPPTLLPTLPDRLQTGPSTPTRRQGRALERTGSNATTRYSVLSTRSANRLSALTPGHRCAEHYASSEAEASVVSSRKARSVTGRLGYINPRSDPYLHDEDGGPLEPDPDYVTPDVYTAEPSRAAEQMTALPLRRKFRRWTDAEALLLYRTVQKAWWSERTAQQVAWYLHGERGRLSQRLKAFTVQNMKDKMREIVKTRVRNERAVVGRARHWLPASHPDRIAYEEEMVAWADSERERQEQEEAAKREGRRSEAWDEEDQSDGSQSDSDSVGDVSQNENVDWEANPNMLIDVNEVDHHLPSDDESDAHAGISTARPRVASTAPGTSAADARWRAANPRGVDELASEDNDTGSDGDLADDISIADSDLGLAEPADFPAAIDIATLLKSHKRRSPGPGCPSPKRRHLLALNFNRPLARVPTRPSGPPGRENLTIYSRGGGVQERSQDSSASDSSVDGSSHGFPASGRRASAATPITKKPLAPLRNLFHTEPRPPHHAMTASREANSPRTQSSPSGLYGRGHGPRLPALQVGKEPIDGDINSNGPRSPSRQSSEAPSDGTAASSPDNAPQSEAAAPVAADEADQSQLPPRDPHDHRLRSTSQEPAGLPRDSQVSIDDTQTLGTLAPRTTVVARARRGGMRPRPSRHVPIAAEATAVVREESRNVSPAPAASDLSDNSDGDEGERQEEPRSSQSWRQREIARKVMGV